MGIICVCVFCDFSCLKSYVFVYFLKRQREKRKARHAVGWLRNREDLGGQGEGETEQNIFMRKCISVKKKEGKGVEVRVKYSKTCKMTTFMTALQEHHSHFPQTTEDLFCLE